MSNKIYDLKYYNEYQKQRYMMNEVTKSEYPNVARILGRVSKAELMHGKDLYDFNLPEIKQFLSYLNPGKLSTSKQNAYIVQNYIKWADVHHLRQTNINPMVGSLDNDFFKKFIDKTNKKYFSEDEIYQVIKKCVNAQDSVIISLIFEGVMGDENCELLNLQRKSIDFENRRLQLKNKDGSTRIHVVSDQCINLIDSALEQKEYHKRNGNPSVDVKTPIVQLVDSDFVIRLGKLRINPEGITKRSAINRRLTKLNETVEDLDFDLNYFTPKNIWCSGMLKMAKDLYVQNGKLEKDEFTLIGKRFNVGKIFLNGEHQYNMFPNRKQFLNKETINKLYANSM